MTILTRRLNWPYNQITRWPDDHIDQMTILTRWPDDQMTRWPYYQMIKWQDDHMTRWPDDNIDHMARWLYWPDEQMTKWLDDQMTILTRWPYWPDDQMTIWPYWQDDQMTRWPADQMTILNRWTDYQMTILTRCRNLRSLLGPPTGAALSVACSIYRDGLSATQQTTTTLLSPSVKHQPSELLPQGKVYRTYLTLQVLFDRYSSWDSATLCLPEGITHPA